jgi:hypothetical protein
MLISMKRKDCLLVCGLLCTYMPWWMSMYVCVCVDIVYVCRFVYVWEKRKEGPLRMRVNGGVVRVHVFVFV